jgi:hypothetical protein
MLMTVTSALDGLGPPVCGSKPGMWSNERSSISTSMWLTLVRRQAVFLLRQIVPRIVSTKPRPASTLPTKRSLRWLLQTFPYR